MGDASIGDAIVNIGQKRTANRKLKANGVICVQVIETGCLRDTMKPI